MTRIRKAQDTKKLEIEHEGHNLGFIYPHFGPAPYAELVQAIDEAGLAMPTFGQTVSLVHTAHNSTGKYTEEIRDLMKEHGIVGNTASRNISGRWSPFAGWYYQDNPNMRDYMPDIPLEEIRSGVSPESEIRFVRDSFCNWSRKDPSIIHTDQTLITLAGYLGARKLQDIANKYPDPDFTGENARAMVAGIDNVVGHESKLRIPGLASYVFEFGLSIGNYDPGHDGLIAFGVDPIDMARLNLERRVAKKQVEG